MNLSSFLSPSLDEKGGLEDAGVQYSIVACQLGSGKTHIGRALVKESSLRTGRWLPQNAPHLFENGYFHPQAQGTEKDFLQS